MNPAAFQKYLSETTDDLRVCREFLLSSSVWLLKEKSFPSPEKTYDEMKVFLSTRLKIPNANIGFVGSAKVGFSLSPKKNYRAFDPEESDLDVVLVSRELFEMFWSEMLRLFYARAAFIGPQYHQSVFRKFIWLRRNDDLSSELMRSWHQKMDEIKRDFYLQFNISNDLTYRIYESWQAVEDYHVAGIASLRKNLKGTEDVDS